MNKVVVVAIVVCVAGIGAGSATAQQISPNGVKTLAPAGASKPTGTWNLGTRAGDFISSSSQACAASTRIRTS